MKRLLSLVTFALAVATTATTVHAQDMGAVQRRMADRQSSLDSLKKRELVGEDNRGFLSPRGALSADESAVVSSENADRGLVYAELAKRNSTTPETVGKLRAKKIAENSTAGIWLQDEAGKWYKK